jgi:hypothetical protein
LGDIVALTTRQDETYWIAQGIGGCMDFGA